MDFDANLMRLQATLNSLERKKLLNEKGAETVELFQKTYTGLSDEVKEQVTFFLLLNTNLKISSKLKDDLNVGHLVHICPLITKEFFIYVAFECGAQTSLTNILKYCPSVIVCDILDTLIPKLQHGDFHKEHYGTSYLSCIVEAVMFKIVISERKGDLVVEKLNLHFKTLIKLLESVICTSAKLGLQAKYKTIAGIQCANFFSLLLNSLKAYNSPSLKVMDLYELTADLYDDDDVCSATTSAKQSFELLLKTCDKILDCFTMDLWITWDECFANDKDKSIQAMIGETVYHLWNELESSDLQVSKETMQCLRHLKIKPILIEDLIEEANLEMILEKLSTADDEWQRMWFEALIKHEEAFSDGNHILKFLRLANDTDVLKIMCKIEESVRGRVDLSHSQKLLYLTCFKKLNAGERSKKMEELFVDEFEECFELPDFDCQLTETFNKLTNHESVVVDVTGLCVQAPRRTISKLCRTALTDLGGFAVDILKDLQAACRLRSVGGDGRDVLTGVLCEIGAGGLGEKEERGFVELVGRLTKEGLVGECYLKRGVMEAVRGAMSEGRWSIALLGLRLLEAWVKSNSSLCPRSVLVAAMVAVLELCSWDCTSYTAWKAALRQAAVSIISHLRDGDDDAVSAAWLRHHLSTAWPANRVYVCDTWFRHGLTFPDLEEPHVAMLALVHTKCRRQEIADAVCCELASRQPPLQASAWLDACLIKILPVLMEREWSSLFSRLKLVLASFPNEATLDWVVLQRVASAMELLSLQAEHFPEELPCFESCVRHFGRLVQTLVPSLPDSSCLELLSAACRMVAGLSDDAVRSSCCLTLSPVLLDMTDRARPSAGDHIRNIANSLRVDSVEKAILNRLTENESKYTQRD